jgi:hypothetical protein
MMRFSFRHACVLLAVLTAGFSSFLAPAQSFSPEPKWGVALNGGISSVYQSGRRHFPLQYADDGGYIQLQLSRRLAGHFGVLAGFSYSALNSDVRRLAKDWMTLYRDAQSIAVNAKQFDYVQSFAGLYYDVKVNNALYFRIAALSGIASITTPDVAVFLRTSPHSSVKAARGRSTDFMYGLQLQPSLKLNHAWSLQMQLDYTSAAFRMDIEPVSADIYMPKHEIGLLHFGLGLQWHF